MFCPWSLSPFKWKIQNTSNAVFQSINLKNKVLGNYRVSKKTEFYQSFWRFCFQLGRNTHKYHDKSGNAQLGKPQFFWTLCRKANDHSYLSYSCNISTLPILGNIYPYQGHDFRQQRCFIRAQTRPQIRRHVERSGKGWTAELRRDSLRVLLPRGLVKNQGKRYTAELLGLCGVLA